MNSTVQDGLRIASAAKRAGVTPRTVWSWIHEGIGTTDDERIRLKATKMGRKWLIDPADLDEFSRRLTEAALAGGRS